LRSVRLSRHWTFGVKDSAALQDVPEPPDSDGSVLVETLAVGICRTDLEIVAG
jgi:threonine dehydrogenase-like Zn-dependent dehydrogenase